MLAFSFAGSYLVSFVGWAQDWEKLSDETRAEELLKPLNSVNSVLTLMMGLASFLLALFISLVMSRWHTLRMDVVGGFYSSSCNIASFVGNSYAGTSLHLYALRRRTLRCACAWPCATPPSLAGPPARSCACTAQPAALPLNSHANSW